MWESGKLDTRLMFYSSCPFILGQQQTNALAPADQKRGWLVMLSPLLVALSLDKLQLLPTSWGFSMQWLL